MTEAEWLACGDPELLLAHLAGSVGGRKCRLLACACVRKDSFTPDEFGCQTAVFTAERLADGLATAAELAAAIEATERGMARATNAWSYLAAAAATTLHPVAIEAASLTLDHLDTFNLELVSRTDQVGCVKLVRDIFGNPFRPVAFSSTWQTITAVGLANLMYESRDFSPMPILADALQDAGCDDADILAHCRGSGPHVRGCWAVDLVLGKG